MGIVSAALNVTHSNGIFINTTGSKVAWLIDIFLKNLFSIVISAQFGTVLLTAGSVSLTLYIFSSNELRNLDQRVDALNKAYRGIWNLGGRGVSISEMQMGKKNEVDYLCELNSEDRSLIEKVHGEETGKIDCTQPGTSTLRALTKGEDLECYLMAIDKVKSIIGDHKTKAINKRGYLRKLIIIFFLLGILIELFSLIYVRG
jgi:hypothetical protein